MAETINSSSQQCPPLPLLQNFETARRSNITQFVFDRKRHSAETVGERDKERRKEKKRSKDDEDGDGNHGGANFQIEVRDLYTTNILVS